MRRKRTLNDAADRRRPTIGRLFAPFPHDRRFRRLAHCCTGVAFAGVAFALMIQADLGLGPWEVLADGVHERAGIAIGTAAIAVALGALAMWIPLRQRIGAGTAISVFLFGVTTNVALPHVPLQRDAIWQWGYLTVAIPLWGFGIALYLSAGLGAGPRDGIMTALARRGHSIRTVRTIVELTVLVIGVWLGGEAGVGTVLFALSIGPCIHQALHAPRLRNLMLSDVTSTAKPKRLHGKVKISPKARKRPKRTRRSADRRESGDRDEPGKGTPRPLERFTYSLVVLVVRSEIWPHQACLRRCTGPHHVLRTSRHQEESPRCQKNSRARAIRFSSSRACPPRMVIASNLRASII